MQGKDYVKRMKNYRYSHVEPIKPMTECLTALAMGLAVVIVCIVVAMIGW